LGIKNTARDTIVTQLKRDIRGDITAEVHTCRRGVHTNKILWTKGILKSGPGERIKENLPVVNLARRDKNRSPGVRLLWADRKDWKSDR